MYADASTYSGPDEDPLFDYDDELTVMAKDLGQSRAPEMPSNFPENVIKDSFVEVGIADPLQEGNIYGFFYLFESARKEDGGGYFWRPDAGQKRVQYEFRLTTIDENGSNAYKDVYDMHSGRNPEDTWFSSDFYDLSKALFGKLVRRWCLCKCQNDRYLHQHTFSFLSG